MPSALTLDQAKSARVRTRARSFPLVEQIACLVVGMGRAAGLVLLLAPLQIYVWILAKICRHRWHIIITILHIVVTASHGGVQRRALTTSHTFAVLHHRETVIPFCSGPIA